MSTTPSTTSSYARPQQHIESARATLLVTAGDQFGNTPNAHAHFSDALSHLKYACDQPITSVQELLEPATESTAFEALFVLEDALDALRWATHETARGLVKTLIAENLNGAASLELDRTDTGCIPVAIRHRTGQLLWSRTDSLDGGDKPAWEHSLETGCAYLNNSVWDEDAPEAVLARARGDFHEYMTL